MSRLSERLNRSKRNRFLTTTGGGASGDDVNNNVSDAAPPAAPTILDNNDDDESAIKSLNKKLALAKAHKQPVPTSPVPSSSPPPLQTAADTNTRTYSSSRSSNNNNNSSSAAPASSSSDQQKPAKTVSSALLLANRSMLEKRRKAIARAKLTKQQQPSPTSSGAHQQSLADQEDVAELPALATGDEIMTPAKNHHAQAQASEQVKIYLAKMDAVIADNSMLDEQSPERPLSPSRLVAMVHTSRGRAQSFSTPPREYNKAGAAAVSTPTMRSPSPSPNRPRLRLAASPTPDQPQPPPSLQYHSRHKATSPYNRSSSSQPEQTFQSPPKSRYTPLPEQDLDHETIPKIEVVLGEKQKQQMARRYGGAAQLSAQIGPRSSGGVRPPSPSRAQLHQHLAQPRAPSPLFQQQQSFRRQHDESPERVTPPDAVNGGTHLLQSPVPPPEFVPSLQQQGRIHKPSPGSQPIVDPLQNKNDHRRSLSIGRYKLRTVQAPPPPPAQEEEKVPHAVVYNPYATAPGIQGVDSGNDNNQLEMIQQPFLEMDEEILRAVEPEQSNGMPRSQTGSSAGTQRPLSPTHPRKWYLERHTETATPAPAVPVLVDEPAMKESENDDGRNGKTPLSVEQAAGRHTPTARSMPKETSSANRWGVHLKQVKSIVKSSSSDSAREFAALKQGVVDSQIEQSSSWKSASSGSQYRRPSLPLKASSSGSEDFPESMTLEIDQLQDRPSAFAQETTRQRTESNQTEQEAHSIANHSPGRPGDTVAKAKWLMQRANENEDRTQSSIASVDMPDNVMHTDSLLSEPQSSFSTTNSGPSPKAAYQCSMSEKGASLPAERSRSSVRATHGSARYGRSPSPFSSQQPRRETTVVRPSWVKDRSPSPNRTNLLAASQSLADTTSDVSASTTFARMRAQSLPRDADSPRLSDKQQEGHRVDIETPAKVSVSSMAGRFAMPTASSSAKRSPRRPQVHKSFFNQSLPTKKEEMDAKQDSQSEPSELDTIMPSRSVIETPDKVSVADMKGLFGNSASRHPRSKSFSGTGRTSPSPHWSIKTTGSKDMEKKPPKSELPRYRQPTASLAYATKVPSSGYPSASVSWKPGQKSQPLSRKEAAVPPWVLRYKGDEKVVESAPREQLPSHVQASEEKLLEGRTHSFPVDQPTPRSTSSNAQKLSQRDERRPRSASLSRQIPATNSTVPTKDVVEQSFDVVGSTAFDHLDALMGLTSSPVDPISPRTLAMERSWVEDTNVVSPRSRQLRERILEGQQSRAQEVSSNNNKPADLTSRLAMIRDKLRDQDGPNFSFEEEKKCEETTPRLKSPNSLSRLAGDSIHAFDHGRKEKLSNPFNHSAEDEESIHSDGVFGAIPDKKMLPVERAHRVLTDDRQHRPQRLSHGSAIFGDPETFSTVPVSERAKAIASWQGGLGVTADNSEKTHSRFDSDGEHLLIEIVDTNSSDLQHQSRLPTSNRAEDGALAKEIASAFVPNDIPAVKARVSSPARESKRSQELSSSTKGSSSVLRFWSSTTNHDGDEADAWKDQDPEPVMDASTAFDGSFISDITGNHNHSFVQGTKKPDPLDFTDPFFAGTDASDPFTHEAVAAFNGKTRAAPANVFDPFWDSGHDEHVSFNDTSKDLFAKAKLAPTSCASPAVTTFSIPSFDPDVKPTRKSSPAVDFVPSSGRRTVETDDIVWSFDADSVHSDSTPLSRGVEI